MDIGIRLGLLSLARPPPVSSLFNPDPTLHLQSYISDINALAAWF